MRTREISNSDDVIDSRDVTARARELLDEYDLAVDTIKSAHGRLREVRASGYAEDSEGANDDPAGELASAREDFAEWWNDNGEELKALQALAEEGEGVTSEWGDGATLIRESYFREYAEQYADDIGAIDRSATWPLNCIDWEKAADDLKEDFSEIDYGGVTYLVRS